MSSRVQLALISVVALSQLVAQQPKFPQPPPVKTVTTMAIPDVIAAGGEWTLVWQGSETADGIIGFNGGLLFAQEQTNRVDKLDKNDKFSIYLSNGHGPGAVAISQGRVVVVERTCTDPGGHLGVKPGECTEPTDVAVLQPKRKVLADNVQGKRLGRVNDLVADTKGGIYFTSGGAFYLNPTGMVSSIGENLRTNGIILSPDEKTLYITNGPVIMALDVQPDGSATNQREWAKLGNGGGNGDGMTIDSKGRVYDTDTAKGVIQVFNSEGGYMGFIPTPRTPISVAFSGPDKKTLYVACLGALDRNGQEIKTEEGVRNTAMSVYKIKMLSEGYKGRAK